MSKNILELLKDKIESYEKTDKSNRIKVLETLIDDITYNFYDQIQNILLCCAAYVRVDSNTTFPDLWNEDELESFEFDDAITQAINVLEETLDDIDKLMDEFPENVNKRNELFKSITENHLERLYETLHHPMRATKFTGYKKPFEKSKHINNIRKQFINNINLFLSRDYEPPNGVVISYQHFLSAFIFYYLLYMVKIPINMLLRIDLTTAKLHAEIAAHCLQIEDLGKYNFRIKRSKTRLEKTKADKMQPVLEAYYKIDKDGMKPHRIATTIKEYLESMQKNPPSIDTIKRYLKEENLI
jgi:predicted RNA-binding protein with RPS1 domain